MYLNGETAAKGKNWGTEAKPESERETEISGERPARMSRREGGADWDVICGSWDESGARAPAGTEADSRPTGVFW